MSIWRMGVRAVLWTGAAISALAVVILIDWEREPEVEEIRGYVLRSENLPADTAFRIDHLQCERAWPNAFDCMFVVVDLQTRITRFPYNGLFHERLRRGRNGLEDVPAPSWMVFYRLPAQ